MTKEEQETECRRIGCTAIADHYGLAAQTGKAREELYELIDALSGDPDTDAAEEIADVYVMLWQMRYLLGIKDEQVGRWIDCKISRQLQRIEDEE